MAGTVLRKCHDAAGKELNIGDDVAFTSSGRVYIGYVYKIFYDKVYMTTQDRNDRPYPDAYKYCDHQIGSVDSKNYKSFFIRKLQGKYGNTRS